MPARDSNADPQGPAKKETAIPLDEDRAKRTQTTQPNEKPRVLNEDKAAQPEAETPHVDAPADRNRGPVGTDGRGAPGHSKPGRR